MQNFLDYFLEMSPTNFEIIGEGFKSNFKRQISEALHIKEKAPDLNIQKEAYRLSLYN